MKKILIHSNTLWSISNFRSDLIRDITNTGNKVSCLAGLDNISSISEKILQSLKAEISFIKIDRKGINPIREIAYLMRLIKYLRREKPDIVLCYTPKPNIYCSIACQILKIPYINTINGLGSGFTKGKLTRAIIKSLYKLALRKSNHVFFHNHDDLNYFIKSKLTPILHSSFIPGSGINPSIYNTNKREKPTQGALKFIFAGRFIKEKGIHDYIHIATKLKAKYHNASFWLVGFLDEGNPSSLSVQELKDLTTKGIVEYKGKTDHILEILSQVDIMVLPSIREGLPRTLLEAASCKMPLVAYDVPGCREIVINGENGFLCKPYDVQNMMKTCEKLLLMTEYEIAIMGRNAREKVINEFSINKVNSYYLNKLKIILKL